MNIEVENKYRLVDPAAARARLEGEGVCFGPPQAQADLYFRHPQRDFRMTDEALRIRSFANEHWITYKGPKQPGPAKTRFELELPLGAGEPTQQGFRELLERLGFTTAATVHKQRAAASWRSNGLDVELAWDEVAGLGTFLEIELCTDQAQVAAAQAAITALAAAWQLGEPERRSYLGLVLQMLGER